jgi:calcineurin-like phosphoesterase family protein
MSSRLWFSSDLHIGHANIIKYCNRPFESADGMDEALISNWNARVQPGDRVILIGDIFFCQADRAREIMHRLNGNKELIYGNHDKMIKNQRSVQDLFTKIHPDLYQETIDGVLVFMCHYPMLSWNKAHHGSFMLHGHVHSPTPMDGTYRRYDVGVDANGYAPVSWNEIKSTINKVAPSDPSSVRSARNQGQNKV